MLCCLHDSLTSHFAALQCPAPGGQAVVITKQGISKFIDSAVPVEKTWDAQNLPKGLNAFCIWPRLAERKQQWHQWSMYV